ncbi:MMPL family transporter [Nocardioides lijunqiniae]|uniref:MMPL family transporter n=1 Tax=Nocardioides lijunqiniae TaxID=2760832 RepID=UPI001877AEFA|nr:MMPL family transporter [Nocardioides lijunqiniae]
MTRLLYRLGLRTAGHPWRTIAVWLGVAVVAFLAAGAVGGTPQDDFNIDRAAAQTGVEQLREHFPESAVAGSSALVVVHDRAGDAVDDTAVADLTSRLSELDHATSVSAPRWSADRDTAVLTVVFDVPVTHPDLTGGAGVEAMEEAAAEVVGDELQVELGGELPNAGPGEVEGTGEIAGVVVALILMTLVLGTVVTAGLPLLVALVGLAVSVAGVTLLAGVMSVSTSAPTVALMVGLGVGIDYALLLITRFLEHLRNDGVTVPEAAGRATATAGRSVVFASAIVLVSLMGLPLAGLPIYSSLGLATGIAVVAVAATALTLVPALCGLFGRRLLPKRERRGLPPRRTRPRREPLAARWAMGVGRRPMVWTLAATLFLITLAAPTLAMRTWPRDVSDSPAESTTRQAYDIIAAELGPGANGPLTVVVDRAAIGDAGVAAATAQLAETDGIAAVGEPLVSPDGEVAVIQAEPAFGPSDARTPDLVEQLRDDLDAAEVTGSTALFSDISGLMAERIWLVVGFVILLSVLLLAAMFRSVVVPVKAAVLNLLSIGAAYGVVTAVFQWGWGAGLLGFEETVPVSSFLPILMFAVLFGLSMDYEVFLLSRIREDWLQTGDARGSVVRGLAATGRVISTAAAVMVAVFLGFATESDLVVQQLGVGMAVAILLDATVVRMVLVPATMTMLGHRSWWLPRWLDRLLPAIEAESGERPWERVVGRGADAARDETGVSVRG